MRNMIARHHRHGVVVTAWVVAALASWGSAADPPAPLPPPPASAASAPAPPEPAAAGVKPAATDTTEQKPAPEKAADPRDGRCDQCGSRAGVRKVCVPRPKEREIKKICWSYTCEDFCIPGPSRPCGATCGKDECGCWSYGLWKPGCAELRTRKVPVKTEVTRKVPGVEWKPEERCVACRSPGRGERSCAAADER